MQYISNILYPGKFNSEYIVSVEPLFTDAFSEFLERSGRKFHVLKQFEQRLDFLEKYSHMSFQKGDWFESIKGYKDIFSIRIKDKDLNVRIPFVFYTYNFKEHVVLLPPFLEKKSGSAKTESYFKHIPTVLPILAQMEEIFKNEF